MRIVYVGNSIHRIRLERDIVAVITNYGLHFTCLGIPAWGRYSFFALVMLLAAPILTEAAQDLSSHAAKAEELLRWVESASPDEYFQLDSSAGKYKFYETFGVAPDIPGVGSISYSKCYSGVVDLFPIQGMSDVVYSERHGKLNKLAAEFATAYNRKMKLLVDAKGLSKCKANVDWETAFKKLNEFVWGQDRRQGIVGIHPDSNGISQWIISIVDRDRADNVRQASCTILAQYGIAEPVDMTLNEWLLPPPPGYRTKPLDKFRCIGGKASP